MYLLIVKGARRATLAVHKVETESDLRELLDIYRRLGHAPEMLLVEDRREKAA